ncbi:isochorismatase family protein [Actinomycetaceae bacterium MB13-C1-2]|nr:isochorismatase family protein [Actinomycetaceae bacterium MB13-C1-2]
METPRRALVVVDVQNEYFQGPLTIKYPAPEEALEAIISAIETAKTASIPVALIQHENPAGASVFASGSQSQRLHPSLEALSDLPRFVKNKASIFTSQGFTQWLADNQIDTVTLVGFMANNCLLASAAAAETQAVSVEVISDASGTINLGNRAGTINARHFHETLMVLLHSNWATVTDTETWKHAIHEDIPLTRSTLVTSAIAG